MPNKRKKHKMKRSFAFVVSFGLMMGASKSFGQTPAPTPPQHSPGQVLNDINPFKKNFKS